MRHFKPFMRNKCGYFNCQNDKCIKCKFYKPYFYFIRIPKWLANILYNIEYWLINLEF